MPLRRTDSAERRIAAPAARLFSCWTDPALLVHWLPPRGMTGRVEVFDPRPGAPFRIVLALEEDAGRAGPDAAVIAGQFVALEPPRHLAFVSRFRSDDPGLSGDMRMDWHFHPDGNGTRVRIVATNVPPGIPAQDHVTALESSLTQLAALVE